MKHKRLLLVRAGLHGFPTGSNCFSIVFLFFYNLIRHIYIYTYISLLFCRKSFISKLRRI